MQAAGGEVTARVTVACPRHHPLRAAAYGGKLAGLPLPFPLAAGGHPAPPAVRQPPASAQAPLASSRLCGAVQLAGHAARQSSRDGHARNARCWARHVARRCSTSSGHRRSPPSGPMHRMPLPSCPGCACSPAATARSGGASGPTPTRAASAARIRWHSCSTLVGGWTTSACGRRHCFIAAVATRAQRPSRPLAAAIWSPSSPPPATAGNSQYVRQFQLGACATLALLSEAVQQAAPATWRHPPLPLPTRLPPCNAGLSPSPPLPMLGLRCVSSGVRLAAPSSAAFSTSQSERPPLREPQAQATSHCQPCSRTCTRGAVGAPSWGVRQRFTQSVEAQPSTELA